MPQNPVTACYEDANGNVQVVNPANPLPVGGGVAGGATDSGNPVKVGAVYNSPVPTYTSGQRTELQTDNRGSLNVNLTQTGGTGTLTANSLGSEGIANTTVALVVRAYASLFNGTTWDRESKATATARIVSSAASTNATSAKAASGTMYSVDALNTSASVKYLKLYNKATAPTVGTDTPVLTLALPPNNVAKALTFHLGMYFSAGIACALTGAAADADATALAAGDVVGVNITYS